MRCHSFLPRPPDGRIAFLQRGLRPVFAATVHTHGEHAAMIMEKAPSCSRRRPHTRTTDEDLSLLPTKAAFSSRKFEPAPSSPRQQASSICGVAFFC